MKGALLNKTRKPQIQIAGDGSKQKIWTSSNFLESKTISNMQLLRKTKISQNSNEVKKMVVGYAL